MGVEEFVRQDIDAWASETICNYSATHPSASYGDWIDRLFLTAEDRQRETSVDLVRDRLAPRRSSQPLSKPSSICSTTTSTIIGAHIAGGPEECRREPEHYAVNTMVRGLAIRPGSLILKKRVPSRLRI